MKKLTVFAIALSATLVTGQVWAQQYELIKGKSDNEIDSDDCKFCMAYLENLNSFPPETPPMVCEAKINPAFPDFNKPNWRKWSRAEMWDRRELIKNIEQSISDMHPSGDDINDDKFYAELENNLDDNKNISSISEAMVQRDDGELAPFIKYEFYDCDPLSDDYEEPAGRIFLILNEYRDNIIGVESGANMSQTPFRRPDLILYQGKPFLQYWNSGELSVPKKTCKYTYKLTQKRQEK